MKKVLAFTFLGALALAGCSDHNLNIDQTEQINDNAASIFGLIDPKQDWSNINSSSITVLADAPLKEIVKVQILTASPFFYNDGKVLAEKSVTKGQSTTITFDAPKTLTRLIAACMDSQGRYYIKGFNVGENSLSFKSSSAMRTRGTRSDTNYPDASKLTMKAENSFLSYNTMRTQFADMASKYSDPGMLDVADKGYISGWTNSGWDDRLWRLYPLNWNQGQPKLNDTWEVAESSVRRRVPSMTDEERQTITDVMGEFIEHLKEGQTWNRKNNLASVICQSTSVKFYNNELVSDGETPITILPVWMPSSEINQCHLYYYYYSPSNVPSGMSVADYIKTLPKFKCMHTQGPINDLGLNTKIDKGYEYLLPYYGEPSAFEPTLMSVADIATTDGKMYRIRNLGKRTSASDDTDYYITYTGSEMKHMMPKYADNAQNLDLQLWQVFTLNSGGGKLLYNIGAKKFFQPSGNWDTYFTDDYTAALKVSYDFDEEGHIYRRGQKKGLGTNWSESSKINKMYVVSDKQAGIGDYAKWSFEEYNNEGKAVTPATDPKLIQLPNVTSPSLTIPKGYHVGFMLWKVKGTGTYYKHAKPYPEDSYRDLTDCGHGCCYSYSGLNKEINTLPAHFGSASSKFTMKPEDPRTAYFTANGRTYIAFEDGSDCNYNDMVIEVGGYDKEALEEAPEGAEEEGVGIVDEILYEDIPEAEGQAFTMCFEDRPNIADYDMNDVVLRCIRVESDVVEMTLLATGAEDNLTIAGIEGTPLDGETDLQGTEIHEFFGVGAKTGSGRFVNTLSGKGTEYPVVSCKYRVDPNLTIPQLLNRVYIVNMSTGGREIRVPQKGEAPFALIVPGDFDYPVELQSIIGAYDKFLNWAQDINQYGNWPNYQVDGKVIINRYHQ